jgi:hypothetical protein
MEIRESRERRKTHNDEPQEEEHRRDAIHGVAEE